MVPTGVVRGDLRVYHPKQRRLAIPVAVEVNLPRRPKEINTVYDGEKNVRCQWRCCGNGVTSDDVCMYVDSDLPNSADSRFP